MNSFFLVSLGSASLQAARSELMGGDIDVARAWETQGTGADFMVVEAPSAHEVAGLLDSAGVSPLGIGEIKAVVTPPQLGEISVRGALDREIIPPSTSPHGLADVDVAGWIEPYLVWCDTCHAFRESGHKHTE